MNTGNIRKPLKGDALYRALVRGGNAKKNDCGIVYMTDMTEVL